MKKRLAGIAFLLLGILIISVSAFVYDQAQQTIGQTVVNVATLTLKNSALGNLEEGETKSYTKANVANLGAAISLTTVKANVYLHLNSDIDALTTYYTTYTVTVKYITVPTGQEALIGTTAATMSIASPDPSGFALPAAGSWAFDFELTTTAKAVSSNQTTTATIDVTAEST
jgi:hypothetical protein